MKRRIARKIIRRAHLSPESYTQNQVQAAWDRIKVRLYVNGVCYRPGRILHPPRITWLDTRPIEPVAFFF